MSHIQTIVNKLEHDVSVAKHEHANFLRKSEDARMVADAVWKHKNHLEDLLYWAKTELAKEKAEEQKVQAVVQDLKTLMTPP